MGMHNFLQYTGASQGQGGMGGMGMGATQPQAPQQGPLRAQLLAEGMALASGVRSAPPEKVGSEYSTSYNASDVTMDLDYEVQRLRTQADLTWPKERDMLKFHGFADGLRVLEIGCGPGWMTQKYLEEYANIHVVCVEMDPKLIEKGLQNLPEHLKGRLEYISGNIENVKLDPESFDLAVARFVFQHVPDPVATASVVGKALRKGGRLVVIDVDDGASGFVEPPLPALMPLGPLMLARQHRQGGDRTIGRRLGRVLILADFEKIRMDSILCHVDEDGFDLAKFKGNMDVARFKTLVRDNIISNEEYETARNQVELFFMSEFPIIATLNVIASGVRV